MENIFEVHKNLYIGGYWPALNFQVLKETGITAIVNLMEEDLYDPRSFGFSYLYRGFPDDWYIPEHYIKEILSFIDKHIKNGKVFVHCARGVSRSGGIVAAWLLKQNIGWKWCDALDYISKSRLIFPAIEIKESIFEYFLNVENRVLD
jgi:protein-tyrosine phosphatase